MKWKMIKFYDLLQNRKQLFHIFKASWCAVTSAKVIYDLGFNPARAIVNDYWNCYFEALSKITELFSSENYISTNIFADFTSESS